MIKILIVLFISIPMFLLGYYFGAKPNQNNVSVLELSGARNDLKIYSQVSKLTQPTEEIQTTVAQSILKHILMLRTVNPDIQEIKGNNLETLCLLSQPETLALISKVEPKQLAGISQEYLVSIKAKIMAKIAIAQKGLGGKGCFLTPNKTM